MSDETDPFDLYGEKAMHNETGQGIQCPKCLQKIYSEQCHDYHHCDCGYSSVDGGRDYLRYGWGGDKWPQPWEKPTVVERPKGPLKKTESQKARDKRINDSFKTIKERLAGRTSERSSKSGTPKPPSGPIGKRPRRYPLKKSGR